MPQNDSTSTTQIRRAHLRVMLMAAGMIVLTALLAGMAAVLPFYQSSRTSIENSLQMATDAHADALHHQLIRYQDIARQFVSRTEIRRQLEAHLQGEVDLEALQAFTQPRLADAMRQLPDVAGLVRQRADGIEITRLGLTPPQATPGTVQAAGYPCRILRLADQTILIQACAPILDENEQVIGHDLVYFQAQPLLSLLQLDLRQGADNRIWLTDSSGQQIVVHSAGRVSITDEIQDSLLAGVDTRAMLHFQAPLGDGDWQLYTTIPAEQVHQQVRQLLVWPAFTILLLALAGALLANYLIGPLLRKVRRQARELEHFAQHQRQAASVFRYANEAILITNPYNSIVEANPAFLKLMGYNNQHLLGTPLQRLLVQRAGLADDFRKVLQQLEESDAWQGEIHYQRADGSTLVALQTISVVRNDAGTLIRYIHIFNDITANKQAEEAVRHQALHDELTGLPNRAALESRLDQRLSHRRQDDSQAFAVLFLDLDHFKEVNDTLGHRAGDDLLCMVTERLQRRLRTEDMLARLGGDEFIIVLDPLQNLDSAAQVASNMIAELTRPFILGSHQAQIGASIGIATYPVNGQDSQSLLEAADAAMYRAKDAGRNTWFVAGSTSNEQLPKKDS